MHRFFIAPENIFDNTVLIDKEQSWHIEKVLRLKSEDIIVGFDGLGHQYELILGERHNGMLQAQIKQVTDISNESPLNLCLVQGIARGEKMDTIIQKAVEIGIKKIYPLLSEHTVVKLQGEKAVKKVERWQSIAREACKQCRRNIVPDVYPIQSLPDIFGVHDNKQFIMLYENEEKMGLKSILRERPEQLKSGEILLIIGPEGGFSPAEVEYARNQGALIAGLGPRILRTETAGLTAASIIMYELGDLG